MSEKVKCEIAICMDENGNWAERRWNSNQEAVDEVAENGGMMLRTVKITVRIAPPEITEVELDIPDEAGETTKVEAEAV